MSKYVSSPIYLNETPRFSTAPLPAGEYVSLLGETFYKIQHFDAMPPFFMSIVSSTDHWLFLVSTGGLTAGRGQVDNALFPYYTEDKLAENGENTGSKTILRVTRDARTYLWEPFSIRQEGLYQVERNLYKNIPGTGVVFEEINHSLELTFRYAWRTGEQFGFVKTAWLNCTARMPTDVQVELLDGLQNILPANVNALTQNRFSCLLDAYKRNETLPDTHLGIFALNATLTDLAEPSESLLASTVFQIGLPARHILLSSRQLEAFRAGGSVSGEQEVRGQRGAYFVHAVLAFATTREYQWHLVADVKQDHSAILRLQNRLRVDSATLPQAIEQDIDFNTFNLQRIVASADGVQVSANRLGTSHHFANVLFNIMRGGIFADQYRLQKGDLCDFVRTHQPALLQTYAADFAQLPERISLAQLHALAAVHPSPDVRRLWYTYLPLTFSRRHGDPSRPWNQFAINLKQPNGAQRLDYEGNWRDIFQNWEALAYAYPEYIESMLFTFLSATTVDGYNPYRITRAGVDWEVLEEGNPWSNIGYWSDHQIIYLQKLMEFSTQVHPGALFAFFNQPLLSYANVPYRIAPYADLLKDPGNTIRFDEALHLAIENHMARVGSDARLLAMPDGQVVHATLIEKLLTLLLAKLVNFVPEGGIWMNTQRPEWNDANNALVGKGLSVVTLAYLYRFVAFFIQQVSAEGAAPDDFVVNSQILAYFEQVYQIFDQHQSRLSSGFSDEQRRALLDELGNAGSAYRAQCYAHGLPNSTQMLSRPRLQAFLRLVLGYFEHSLRANRRADDLYHAYNILHLAPNGASIARLPEMLEGQVAMLSSGLLSAQESLALLHSLRNSQLYRPDQHTYLLYPDKELPGFLQKNNPPAEALARLQLPSRLAQDRDPRLFVQDYQGNFHFSGNLHNVKDVHAVLHSLRRVPEYAPIVQAEAGAIAELFEITFRHAEFTGRSGTFFGYEGLGSVYWHMVSKLLLAVQETAVRFQADSVARDLRAAYSDIRAGLGFNKTPAAYGAFPTDPYSHTPKHSGARQPGMTGMVKEEIITRYAEVGISLAQGCIHFSPFLLDPAELLSAPQVLTYLDVASEQQQLEIPAQAFVSFLCQTPILVQAGESAQIELFFADETSTLQPGTRLDAATSQHIFQRDGWIKYLMVSLPLLQA
ncbi:MAG TPA: hypothetical protein PK299_11425 [Anaerolineales bacterium]|nr:hypothetical protein [Anaerolineales bacterium]